MIFKSFQIDVRMKKRVNYYLIFSLLFVFSNESLIAKIWRVNNAPGINADFNNLQTAHNSANAGDTLYVEGTPSSYGGLTCTKRLSLFGPGYFLAENENTSAIKNHAHIDGISFNEGSQGSLFCGFYVWQPTAIRVNNIQLKRNFYNGVVQAFDKDSILIAQNYFNYLSAVIIYQDYPVIRNIRISNNIIIGYLQLNNAKSALVYNNLFQGSVQGTESFFVNNLFIETGNCNSSLVNSINQNLFSNNIFCGTGVGSVNGNQANVDLSTVFLVAPTATKPQDVSTDGRWQLKVGSPAKAAGFGSTNEKPVDIGPFGGTDPYVLSGLPPIPSIYFFEHQPMGSNADPLDVRIKVISRN